MNVGKKIRVGGVEVPVIAVALTLLALFFTGGSVVGLIWSWRTGQFNRRNPGGGNSAENSLAASGTESAWHRIDLSSHFNDSLDTGWQHELMAGNNLDTLPKGRHVFGGVEFDVRGIIQLTSPKLRRYATRVQFPEQVHGIQVGRKCRALHFLHATGWNAASDRWVGTYVIHYAGGEKVSEIIIYGEGTGNWWAMPADMERPPPSVVWQGTNAANHAVQLFKQSWTNPRPDLEIESLDFTTQMTRVAPFLIAITAEP